MKNGETYNGHLVSCDTWMNINLREVICTSKVSFCKNFIKCIEFRLTKVPSLIFDQDGDKFWRMNECYIRGSTIKYLRIPDEVIDLVKEDIQAKTKNRNQQQQNRGPNNQQNNRNNFGKNNRQNQNQNQNQNRNMPKK